MSRTDAWRLYRRSLTLFCLVLVALVAILEGTSADAAHPGSNGLIAFESDRSGSIQIWVVNEDGGGPPAVDP